MKLSLIQTTIKLIKQTTIVIVRCAVIFCGVTLVPAQSIVISEGSYLYIKSSPTVFTDTILHIKSGDLTHLEKSNKKAKTRYITRNKKKVNQKKIDTKSAENNYSCIPVQKHFISENSAFAPGISVQNYVQKAVKTNLPNMINENKLLENKKARAFLDDLRYTDQNTPYRQRPPPINFL